MARSIGEIYNEMVSEKNALTQVSNLHPSSDNFSSLIANIRNNSKVAIWRLFLYIVAVGHWTNEKLFDQHKSEVNELLNDSYKGRTQWVIDWAKSFREGDALEIINGVPRYPDNASGDQPVKFASVRPSGDIVYLYIATEDQSGNRVAITDPTLSSFESFIERVQLPGTYYEVLSLNADTILANIDIYYQGTLNADSLRDTIKNAIDDHIANLPSKGALDGVLYLIDLTDAIQQVEGVRDVVYNSITGNGNEITRKYVTSSGYANFDKDNSTINMNAV